MLGRGNRYLWIAVSVFAALVMTTGARAQPVQTVAPLIDGMSVSTCNCVGNLEVRAQSAGPGLCAVSITTLDGRAKAEFDAPPLVWSDWTVLWSYTGAVGFTISFDTLCDTGAMGQVRYYASQGQANEAAKKAVGKPAK
jgi:hypothetical protein